MQNEMSVIPTQKHIICFLIYGVPRVSNFIEIKRIMVVARCWVRHCVLIFNGYRVSVLQNERSSGGCTTA